MWSTWALHGSGMTITVRWSKIRCALVSRKLNNVKICYELETPRELLSKARTATKDYNKVHSSNSSCEFFFFVNDYC